jgi:hypothetical protein
VPDALPIDPIFSPLVSEPQNISDKIWFRILFFATLSRQRPRTMCLEDPLLYRFKFSNFKYLLVSNTFKVSSRAAALERS